MNLHQLGWNADVQRFFDALQSHRNGVTLQAARVARQDRDSYIVYTDRRAWRVSLRGSLRHNAVSAGDLPVVGDWVAVCCSSDRAAIAGTEARSTGSNERSTGSGGRIEAVAPRRSCVVRKTAGDAAGEQVLAANVDALLICCGLDSDFNLRRIERYLSFAYGSGAAPAVVLTKTDLCTEPGASLADRIAEVEAIAIGVPVLAVSMHDAHALRAALMPLVPEGKTAALVGSSGVGKSTLINSLLGHDEMRTGAVRAHDQRGRHTTTHRQLLLIPGGGVIIDSPGMRELQLWNGATDVDAAFGDIAELAAACRFRDCVHEREPGCAVREAVARGGLPAERLLSYHKQRRELAYLERKTDARARAEETARWKAVHKAARKWYKQKRGG